MQILPKHSSESWVSQGRFTGKGFIMHSDGSWSLSFLLIVEKVKFKSWRLPADWVGKFFQYLYFSWYYSPLTVMWNITDKVSSLLHHFDQQDNDNDYNKAQSDSKNAHGFCVWIFTGKRQRWATKTLTW